MTITDEMLGHYVDGMLGGLEKARVERALVEDPALRERLETHRRLLTALTAHFGPVTEEPVPDRFRALLQPPAAEIVDFAPSREKKKPKHTVFRWPHYGAMAASLAVGILVSQFDANGPGPIHMDKGVIKAHGELARALDEELASSPSRGTTRIGLTFADASGRICRTFDLADASGLACREGSEWRMEMVAANSATAGEYRQAGAPVVLEFAQEMMRGQPFDAAAEKAARDANWRRD